MGGGASLRDSPLLPTYTSTFFTKLVNQSRTKPLNINFLKTKSACASWSTISSHSVILLLWYNWIPFLAHLYSTNRSTPILRYFAVCTIQIFVQRSHCEYIILAIYSRVVYDTIYALAQKKCANLAKSVLEIFALPFHNILSHTTSVFTITPTSLVLRFLLV